MAQPRTKSPLWQALGIAWQLGYTIAIPLVVLTLLGRFLDRQLGTAPWLLLTGVIVSIGISTVALVWKFNKIIASINKENTHQPKS